MMHRAKLGMWPSIDSPVTFTEKMQWLKLNDHNPAYTTMVDKYRAKDLIASRVGSEHVVKTLGAWNSADDIDVSGYRRSSYSKRITTAAACSSALTRDTSISTVPRTFFGVI